jgi:PAS domain S-box-containing protein
MNKFFLSIILPSILAIGCFILAIFLVILPSVEKNSMEASKEMIAELTNTAWSLLEEYHEESAKGVLSTDSAKTFAAERVGKIRYGREGKDYFWIIDQHPYMIMHPYRRDLIGKDLNAYQDPEGKLLFVEATRTVDQAGSGFIYYLWQWKDDSTRVVPKLSYVRAFEPWGWIVGTGIYLDDVHDEIRILKIKLLRIVLVITLIISILLLVIIRQSLKIEQRRRQAEERLRLSRQKYKSLVEASTDGTLMILRDRIIFSNARFSTLSGYGPDELSRAGIGDIFGFAWQELPGSFSDPRKSFTRESLLACRDGSSKEVVVSVSEVPYGDDRGYVLIVREVNPRQQLGKEFERLSEELQTSLLLMNQPIKPYVREIIKCQSDTSIHDAAVQMTRKKADTLFIKQGESVVGMVSSKDLIERVLRRGLPTDRPVIEVMTAPVETIPENALLHEALLKMKSGQLQYLAILDADHQISGMIGHEDIVSMQQNTLTFLIHDIENAPDVDALAKIYRRIPVLAKSLLDSRDRADLITRIISSASDAIHRRIITLSLEELGSPPCPFAFIVMGSEGRREQTLATDQDNAIIYEDGHEGNGKIRRYFLSLGDHVNTCLHTVGYRYCSGEVMARNPKWTQPLKSWKRYFTDWIDTGNPKDILEAAIFFDFRYIFGEPSLVNALRDHVNLVSDNKAVFFYHMAQTVMKYKPPLSLFGSIVGNENQEKGQSLDIKKVLFPVTSCIRLYSIREKLEKTNSMERLDMLFKRGIMDEITRENLALAYNFMTGLRLRSQVESIMENETPGNKINLDLLSGVDVTLLKKFFSEIGAIQSKVGFDFKGTG